MSPARPARQLMTLIAVLLTFASGATDVASFTRLGGVFSSVMTGNIVLLGLSLAKGSVSLATHTIVAVAGYVAGVATGSRVAWMHASVTRLPRRLDPPGSAAARRRHGQRTSRWRCSWSSC